MDMNADLFLDPLPKRLHLLFYFHFESQAHFLNAMNTIRESVAMILTGKVFLYFLHLLAGVGADHFGHLLW